MPALVRRAPFWQRLRTRLDPKELVFWVLEELNDDKYRELADRLAVPIAVGLNLVFVLLRNSDTHPDDDVFGNQGSSRLFVYLHTFVLHGIAVLCCANAGMVFLSKKHYHLLYQPVDEPPTTRSARQVQLDVGNGEETIWQIDVWQPKEFSLTILTFFSPIHVLLYYTLLPASRSYALLVLILGLAMAAQLALLQGRFTQQAQDTKIIHGQVLNEYSTKFVQPLMHRPVRDVAVQAEPQGRWRVDAYSPGVLLNRGSKHVNYTPTSFTTDSGSNNPRPYSNGHTPLPRRISSHSSAKPFSGLRQRHSEADSSRASPAVRYSHGTTNTSPDPNNSSFVNENDGEEIRVVTKQSPTFAKSKRQSLRPGR